MSFFRTHINKTIQEELFNRIDSINFEKKVEGALDPVESIDNGFIKSCWARASVVLGNGDVFSLNSNLENETPITEPLNVKGGNYHRGKPGITSISSTFKEYFLKQATINFYVPNSNEVTGGSSQDPEREYLFDDFKEKYLKFGRYMLVEFGWTSPKNATLPKIDAENIIQFSKGLEDRISETSGNYNAIVGVVTNYTFSQTKDGSYEGTIEISSMGRNIIGQKLPLAESGDTSIENVVGYVNEILANLKDSDSLEEKEKKIFKKLRDTYVNFHSVMNNFDDVVEKYVTTKSDGSSREADGYLSSTEVVGAQAAVSVEGKRNIYNNNGAFMYEPYKKDTVGKGGYSKDKVILVSWGWFEDFILNSYFSFVSANDKILFKTEFFSADTLQVKENIRTLNSSDFEITAVKGALGELPDQTQLPDFVHFNNRCKNHSELYSIGFDKIILPGQTKAFSEENVKTQGIANVKDEQSILLKNLIDYTNKNLYTFKDKNDGSSGVIRNMYFNIDYIKESFKDTQNIEKSLRDFWSKVSNDYGYYWNFSLVENEKVDGRMMVIDQNIGREDSSNKPANYSTPDSPDKIFKFKVFSKNSIVSNLDLTTVNSSEMATLAVYGSNANLESTSADTTQGYPELSMRALSILDNPGVKPNTTDNIKRSQYYDNILQNISNPVYGNFSENEGSVFEGASANYNNDGSVAVENRKRNGGLRFGQIEEVQRTDKENRRRLQDLDWGTGYSNANEEIANTLFWFKADDTNVQIYGGNSLTIIPEFKRTMLYRINKAPGTESNYSVILPIVPIQLSLTLQGIGGIKVGDLFGVDYLPEQYRENCNFLVVNVEHEITTTGWTTKLDSRMVVDIPKMLKNNDSVQRKDINFVFVADNLEATKKRITKYYADQAKTRKFMRDAEDYMKRRDERGGTIVGLGSISGSQRLADIESGAGLYGSWNRRVGGYIKNIFSKELDKDTPLDPDPEGNQTY